MNHASDKPVYSEGDHAVLSTEVMERRDEKLRLKAHLDLAEKERLAGTPGYSFEEVQNKLMEKF